MASKIVVAILAVPIVAETAEFTKGLAGAAKNAASWAADIGKTVAKAGFAVMAAGAAGAVAGIGAVTAALGKLAIKAAPLEGIGMAFDRMAERANVSLGALRQAAAGTISDFELMRQANIALTGAGVEFGQEFGKALPQLLEGARAAARATGQDVGFLFNSLVTGVKRSSPLLIDNTGIVLKLGEANQKLADDLGTTVEQLSAEQKQIAILNATTEAAGRLADEMGLSTLTAAERIAGFTATLKNAGDQIGLALTPEVGNLIGILDTLAQSALSPIIDLVKTGIAPAFSLFVDQLRNVAQVAEESGESFVKNLIGKLTSAAENALRWGVNITTQLATGLIQGAAQAITAAMGFISNMLSSWLSPGSPPRVAKDIVKWGTSAMNEYLRGFTEASFDLLEGLQGPLQSVLTSLVDTGALGADVAKDAFRDMSAQIAIAVSDFQETGKVSTELFDNLRKVGGEFGQDLVKLAEKQIALAGAIDAVRKAEEALTKAQEKQDAAQDRLTAAQSDFNKALAEGTSPEILAAKRAEIEAAKQGLSTAKSEVSQAAKAKEAAKKKINPLKVQVKLQERLIKQLTQMTKGQGAVAKSMVAAMKAAAGVAGGAGAAIAAPGIGGISLPTIDTSALDTTFEDAKERIREKLADIFKPLTDAWEDIRPTLDDITTKWDEVSGLIGEAVDTKVLPALETAWAFIKDNWEPIVAGIAAMVALVVVPAFILWADAAAIAAIGTITALAPVVLPILAIGAAVALLVKAWKDDWGGIRTTLTTIWNTKLKPIFEKLKEWLETNIPIAIEALRLVWEEVLKPALETVWEFIRDSIIPIFEGVADVADAVLGLALRTLAGIWENTLKPALKTVWEFIDEKILPIFEKVSDFVEDTLGPALKTFNETVLTPLKDAFGFIADAAEDLADWLDHIKDLINDIDIPPWAQPGSPPPLADAFTDIGNAVKQLAMIELPRLNMELNASIPGADTLGAMGNVISSAIDNSRSATLNVNTQATTPGIIGEFETARALWR